MEELKPCPFCGSPVVLTKSPLWHGSHGYQNCYEYFIRCSKCGCTVDYYLNNTIYNISEAEAVENVLKTWNRRANENE